MTDEPRVTIAQTYASLFYDAHQAMFDRAALEPEEGQRFRIEIAHFDAWAVQAGILPPVDPYRADPEYARGRSALLNELKKQINSASEHGKHGEIPFRVVPFVAGKIWEVQLLPCSTMEKRRQLPAAMARTIGNKLKEYDRDRQFLLSDEVRQNHPDVYHRFLNDDRLIRSTMRNAVQQIENLQQDLREAAREAEQIKKLQHMPDAAD